MKTFVFLALFMVVVAVAVAEPRRHSEIALRADDDDRPLRDVPVEEGGCKGLTGKECGAFVAAGFMYKKEAKVLAAIAAKRLGGHGRGEDGPDPDEDERFADRVEADLDAADRKRGKKLTGGDRLVKDVPVEEGGCKGLTPNECSDMVKDRILRGVIGMEKKDEMEAEARRRGKKLTGGDRLVKDVPVEEGGCKGLTPNECREMVRDRILRGVAGMEKKDELAAEARKKNSGHGLFRKHFN